MSPVVFACLLFSAAAPAKARLGVADLAPLNGISLEYAALVSDALRTEMYRTGAFELIDRSVVMSAIKETELRQLGVVDNGESLVGKLKGMDKMVVGSVGKVDSAVVLSARRLDLASGRAEVAISNQSAANVDEVLRTVASIAQQLAGGGTAAEVPRVMIAVFEDPAAKPGETSLGEVVADAIAQGLGDDLAVHVFSPFAVAARCDEKKLKYGDTARPGVASDLAKTLGATQVVTGKVQRVGESIIVSSTITDIRSGRVVGSFRTTSKTADGVLDDATRHLAEVRKHVSPNHAAVGQIDDLTTGSLEAYKYFIQGFDAHMVGDYERSIEELRHAIAIDPDFASAYGVLACSYSFLGDDEKAGEMLKKALTYFDRLSAKEQLWLRADEAWLQNDGQLLELYYLHYTRLHPEDSKAWLYLGLARHWKANDPKGAVAAYDKAIQLNPSQYYSWKGKADALDAMKDKKAARKVLEDFIAKYPTSPNLEKAKGRLAQLQ